MNDKNDAERLSEDTGAQVAETLTIVLDEISICSYGVDADNTILAAALCEVFGRTTGHSASRRKPADRRSG